MIRVSTRASKPAGDSNNCSRPGCARRISTRLCDRKILHSNPLWSLLRKATSPGALDSLHRQGRIREISRSRGTHSYHRPQLCRLAGETLIVSPDNASRRDLNIAVREELKAKGSLAPEDHQFKVLVQRQELTGAERRWASGYEIGDVVRYARGSKEAGIEAGTYGTVVGVNAAVESTFSGTIFRERHDL